MSAEHPTHAVALMVIWEKLTFEAASPLSVLDKALIERRACPMSAKASAADIAGQKHSSI